MAELRQYTRDDARITLTVSPPASNFDSRFPGAGARRFDGWLQSEVQRSIENITGTFSVPTSLVPGEPPAIARGDEVEVAIGSKTVIKGYVLSAEPFYRRGDCGLRVTGRDRTGDLVRSSAIHRGGQWRKASLGVIAQDLAAPFGLQVVADVDLGEPIQDFKLAHGETVLDALARAARLRGVLVTRDDQGRLLLTKAGRKVFRGVIRRGWNVIEMAGVGTDEDRHSEYIVYGQANTVADFDNARGLKARSTDPEIGRYLPLIINADGNTTAAELQALADHTARVRRGHSLGFRYLVEGWTFEGEPWPLNQRVRIEDDIAGLDGDEWLIASVRHTCDLKEGDVTELIVRPVEAYDTVPLKSKPVRRRWGKNSQSGNLQPSGPTDGARGGR